MNKKIQAFIITLIPSFIWYETSGLGNPDHAPTIKFGLGVGQSISSLSDFFAAIIGLLITAIPFALFPLILAFIFRKIWFKTYLIGLLIMIIIYYVPAIAMQ